MAGKLIDIPGRGTVEFPSEMSDDDIVAAIKNLGSTKEDAFAGRTEVLPRIKSWSNQAIASLPDALLNTPSNLWNLAKAGVGTATTAMGRPDLAPGITQPPDLVRKGFEKAGFINPELDPSTTEGRLAKAAVQGLTIGPLAPAQSVKQAMVNSAISSGSAATGQGVTEATGQPALGMAATIGATPLLSGGYNAATSAARAAGQRNAVVDETLRKAREAGAVVPPSAVGGGFLERRLEDLAGKAPIAQEASVRNQEVWNALARKALNLPEDTAITESVLRQQRKMLSGPYKEAASIDPQVAQDVFALRQAKRDANLYYKQYAFNKDPTALKQAQALDQQVSQLEQWIEQAAGNAGKPDLMDRLRSARTAIAKNFEVDRTLNVGSAGVSAPVLGKALDRGAPLSGDLQTIARFQQAFPRFAAEAEKVPSPDVNALRHFASAGLGGLGYGSMGTPGALLALLPYLNTPMRAALLSGPVQNSVMNRSYPPLVSDPFLRGILTSQMQGEQ